MAQREATETGACAPSHGQDPSALGAHICLGMMLLPFLGETLSNLQGLGALHVPEASGASEV